METRENETTNVETAEREKVEYKPKETENIKLVNINWIRTINRI